MLSGAYTVSIFVNPYFTSSTGQLAQGCPGAALSDYHSVRANVIVTADGAVSRVRPKTPADGDFELRLARSSAPIRLGLSLSGSIRGVLVNTKDLDPIAGVPVDARVTFSGPAPGTDIEVQGEAADGILASGTVSGGGAIGNSKGASFSCAPEVMYWALDSRVPN
jgi:hypothetical protein